MGLGVGVAETIWAWYRLGLEAMGEAMEEPERLSQVRLMAAPTTRSPTMTMRRAEPFWEARVFKNAIRTHTHKYAPGFFGETAGFYVGVCL